MVKQANIPMDSVWQVNFVKSVNYNTLIQEIRIPRSNPHAWDCKEAHVSCTTKNDKSELGPN